MLIVTLLQSYFVTKRKPIFTFLHFSIFTFFYRLSIKVLVVWNDFSATVSQKLWYCEASVSRRGISLMTRNEIKGTL